MVPAHFVHLIKSRSRNMQCVASWWPLNQFWYLCSYIQIVSIFVADEVHIIILKFLAYGGLPFPDIGCPVPDVCIYCVSGMTMFGILSPHLSTSRCCFCPRTFFNNFLDNVQWASFISYLHAKRRKISRRVPWFATGSTCGVWGRGWTTCLLYDGPLLSLCF